MKPHRLPMADLQVPEEWTDHSVHSFVAPPMDGAGSASFVITRDAATAGDDIGRYVDQHLVEAAKALRGYRVLETRRMIVGGRPSVERTYAWRTPENLAVRQRQVCLRHDQSFIVITMTAKEEDFRAHEPAWTNVMQSIRLT